ncbi:MAG: acyclic terpene utilization AtuA family protein [Pseudomonadota bacterium]
MFRIGCGAGFSSDRLGPAVDLARDGALDVLVFETIGERTLAFGHRDRQANPARGFNPHLAARMRAVLPQCRANGTRIVTNMGVANVTAAAQLVVQVAKELGLSGLTVAAVLGDDVTDQLGPETVLFDYEGRSIADVGRPLVGANAYLGIDAILPALETGADVVITGRVADPSLFLSPLVHHYGWRHDDWPQMGQGTLVGHLMECGMQITGGYFADPGFKDVPRLADCGYPIAEVAQDGTATITKLAGSGGAVTEQTVKEQLLYEVHDPTGYLTPDVTADFATVTVEDLGQDRVRVSGAQGQRRPDQLKVTVGFDGGLLGEAGVSYAGPNALARAALARDILNERLAQVLSDGTHDLRIDLIGVDSLHATADVRYGTEPGDVRVRAAMRSADRTAVELMLWEVEALLCCGPAGGGGYRGQISPSVVTHSAWIDRDAVATSVEVYRT